jgi:hypothetical protein
MAKKYGIKNVVILGTSLETHWELKHFYQMGTYWEHIGNKPKKKSPQTQEKKLNPFKPFIG